MGVLRRRLTPLMLGVVLLGACGPRSGDALPTPTSTPLSGAATASASRPSPTPRPSPGRAAEPSALAAASPEASGGPHAAPDLEARLPTSYVGHSLTVLSFPGSFIPAGGTDMCLLLCAGDPQNLAEGVGTDISAVTVAMSVADSLAPAVIAYRVDGAAPDQLVRARLEMGGYTGSAHKELASTVSIAGRDVTFLPHFLPGDPGEYLWADGDVLFDVMGGPPAADGTAPPEVVEVFEVID